jgi:hypothetical protein
MDSRARLVHWARAEHERYDNRYAVVDAIGTRMAHVFGYAVDESETDTQTQHTRGRAAPETQSTETHIQSTGRLDHQDRDDEFERKVNNSYSIVSSIDDESKLVGMLKDETDSTEPRRHVVAAISRRLGEVRVAASASTDDEPTADSQIPA